MQPPFVHIGEVEVALQRLNRSTDGRHAALIRAMLESLEHIRRAESRKEREG